MKTIHQLSQDTISRIAAGQIIEHPADVIKELVENSLDAHATEITIRIQNYGLDLIEISDNGIGISEEDIHEAIKPHTTSKILSDDLLTLIQTFGFRGEALASIASVSRLTVMSKTKNTLGTKIVVEHGKEVESSSIGMHKGTVVTVSDLFSNTPVRKQFLSSPKTQLNTIFQTIYGFALAHPEVGFTLIHNNKELTYFTKGDTLENRIEKVLGKSLSQQFMNFKINDDALLQVKGFLGNPLIAQTTDSKIYIIVNGRVVKDSLILRAVREGYGSLITARSYPLFVIDITIPYERIHVNIHPKKQEIRFLDADTVSESITNIVQNVLSQNNLTFANVSFGRDPISLSSERKLPEDTLLSSKLKESLVHESITFQNILNTYIIVTTESSITILDQHAADERILYEKLTRELQDLQSQKELYIFEKLEIIDLSQADKELLLSSELKNIGITVEDFGGSTIKLVSVPHIMQDFDSVGILQEVIENIREGKTKQLDKISHKIMTSLSCKYAVMAGKSLSQEDMKRIWEELQLTPNNLTCPHGRPTHVTMGEKELKKIFKR